MTLRYFRTLLILLAALLGGCAGINARPTITVNVDAIASGQASYKKTYWLMPGNAGISIDDLQFQEYAGYIRRGLISSSFRESQKLEDADIVIFVSYGIGDPQLHTSTYSLPVWGQTGYSGSMTTGTVNSYGGNLSYNSYTTYTPTYGITGYSTHIQQVTTYFRYLVLDAYDIDAYKRDKKFSQVWRSTTTSTGSTGDLRYVMPALVIGSFKNWGVSTGQRVSSTFAIDDPAVENLRTLRSSMKVEQEKSGTPFAYNADSSQVDDVNIEAECRRQVSIKYQNAAHVNINSLNRKVLVTGEAPNERIKNEIGNFIASINYVKAVSNELVVAQNISLSLISRDMEITNNVRARFINNQELQSNNVKVIIENGAVYIMGMLRRNQCQTAAEIASTINGVQRVIKVCEYLD
ncbi:MAG: BON domain-containing protein [Nitrosomonadales bacterium]|nr:BON domain-containing protein [Nitrosomonadales bacterium]